METIPLVDSKVPVPPVGRMIWFGNSQRLLGVDEEGNLFRFVERPKPKPPRPVRRMLADWFRGH